MDRNGYNDSLFPTDRCYICGSYSDLVRHEVFHGSRRETSKRTGCWVTLCASCHRNLHERPAQFRWLQEETQKLAMKRFNWSIEEFRNVFGKSYL